MERLIALHISECFRHVRCLLVRMIITDALPCGCERLETLLLAHPDTFRLIGADKREVILGRSAPLRYYPAGGGRAGCLECVKF
jgi:hypothetical protein